MNEVIRFGKFWYTDGMVLLHRGDPLLMGAAIAFNSLFALVPLALAFVSVITLLERSDLFLGQVVEGIDALLPPELASFMIDILEQSESVVSSDRAAILVVSILLALWSGSRAVYAIQKSLRLVQGTADERGYIRARLTGVGVTIGAGAAVFIGYSAMLMGENAWQQLTDWLGMPGVGATRLVTLAVAVAWVFALLYVIYRWGPPESTPLPAITAGIVSAVLWIGTAVATVLVPTLDSAALAVFGSLGLMLFWLYFIGVVVVAIPVGIMSFRSGLRQL